MRRRKVARVTNGPPGRRILPYGIRRDEAGPVAGAAGAEG
jgi:hypothetical protein